MAWVGLATQVGRLGMLQAVCPHPKQTEDSGCERRRCTLAEVSDVGHFRLALARALLMSHHFFLH